MRKKNYVRNFVCTSLLMGSVCFLSEGQNSVLVLKGNVLTPVPAQNGTNQQAQPVKPANTTTTQPATAKQTTPPKTGQATAAPAPKTAQVAVQQKPKAPVAVAAKPAYGKKTGPIDYIKRVQAVHNLVVMRIPQSIIDSIGDVDHMVLDSIRMEMSKHHDKDSISFLKTALANGINDSLTLISINNLVNSAKGIEPTQTEGSVTAYCIDLSSQAPMDSVKVNVKSHDTLVATAYSGTDGFCKIPNLKPGEYSLEFSKNSYTPFSDRWVKVSAGNVTYLEMPLTETPRFYIPRFSPQIWALIIVGVVSVFILIYSIIRRLGRVA